jgi:hypothetical protein
MLDNRSYDGIIKPDSFVSEVHVPPKRCKPSPLHLSMQKAIGEMISMHTIQMRLIKVVLNACMTAAEPQSPTQQVTTVQSRMEQERRLSETIDEACLLHVVVANAIAHGAGK